MPALNIRNVDVTLVTSLKQAALASGMTLRDYCLAKLGGCNGRDAERNDVGRVHGTDSGRAASGKGNRAELSVLPKTEGGKKQLHPLQSLRSELAGQRDAVPGLSGTRPASSSSGSCPHGKRNEAYCRAIKGGC